MQSDVVRVLVEAVVDDPAVTLAAWAGAATMAVAAAHEWTDLPILGVWVASAAATFGVPLAVFRELDRLIEAPGPGLPDGN